MTSTTFAQIGFANASAVSAWIFVAKATIILLAALGVTLLMQRASAGARHLVWLVTLGSLLVVPALAAWSPLRVALLPAAATVSEFTGAPTAGTSSTVSATIIMNGSGAPDASANSHARQAISVSNGVAAQPEVPRMDMVTVLLLIWGAVAFAILASLAGAAIALRRIVLRSQPVTDEKWLAILWEVSDRFGLSEPPALLRSDATQMPFACGVLHPTIVLPSESDEWTLERRRAVMLHELAHVTRHDLLGHTLGRVVSAFYWFHPLVWTAAKRLRSESERACDDLALACGTVPSDYAEHLLDIVTSARRVRTPAVALAMARRKEFEGRMLAILDPEVARANLSRWKVAGLVGSLSLLTVLVGAVSPTRRAARVADGQPDGTSSVERTDAGPIQQTLRSSKAAVSPAAETVPHAVLSQVATASSESRRTAVVNTTIENAASGFAAALLAQLQSLALQAGARGTAGDGHALPDDRSDLLLKVLRSDTSASVRKIAAWGLARYPGVASVAPALVNALDHDTDPNVRETAAWALGRQNGDAATVAGLTNALQHDVDASVRSTSAWALGTIGDATPLNALASALTDASPDVVERSVWAIGRLQPEHSPRGLTAKLSDRDPKVRDVAAWALYRIHDSASVPALEAAVQTEQDRNVKVDEFRALAAIASSSDSSLSLMRRFLDSPDEQIKSMAVTAIAGGNASGPWPWPWPWPRPYP